MTRSVSTKDYPRPGWYQDPVLQYTQRWWTGYGWTGYIRRTPVPTWSNNWLWLCPLFWPGLLFWFLLRTRW